MKLHLLLTTLAVAALSACATSSPHTLPPANPPAVQGPPPLSPSGTYGEAEFDAGKAKDLKKTMPTLKKVASRKGEPETVIIKGKVTEVCPKKGCWMKLETGKEDLRVAFKGYSFFVPVELVGREVALQGHYVVHRETVAEQKHLLEDARRPKEEIEAVKKDKEGLRFIATGVRDLSVTSP